MTQIETDLDMRGLVSFLQNAVIFGGVRVRIFAVLTRLPVQGGAGKHNLLARS
jgi:hypothetical protein